MFDIITDSACDLTLDTAKQLQIEVVPFYVSLDGEHYRKEGKEIAVRHDACSSHQSHHPYFLPESQPPVS